MHCRSAANRCCHRDEYQIRSLCRTNTGTGDAPVNSRAETIGPRGNKCMIFRRKASVSINGIATSRDSRCFARGSMGEADGRGWRGEDRSCEDRIPFEYWHIRNLLSASFPEIADLPRRAFLRTSRSPRPWRPGSSREIVSRRFDGDRAPENLLFSSYVR